MKIRFLKDVEVVAHTHICCFSGQHNTETTHPDYFKVEAGDFEEL